MKQTRGAHGYHVWQHVAFTTLTAVEKLHYRYEGIASACWWVLVSFFVYLKATTKANSTHAVSSRKSREQGLTSHQRPCKWPQPLPPQSSKRIGLRHERIVRAFHGYSIQIHDEHEQLFHASSIRPAIDNAATAAPRFANPWAY